MDDSEIPSPMLDASRKSVLRGDIGEGEIKVTLHHFLMASYDTTAGLLFCAIYCLAYHQDIQEKVLEEIVTVLDESSEISFENLSDLVYMDMVISESLRLFPSGPFVARKSTEDFKLSNGVTVPSGTNFVCSFFHMHRNKKIWGPNASKFNPENFSQENVENRDPNAFMPFAKGPRACLGGKNTYWTMKVFLVLVKFE